MGVGDSLEGNFLGWWKSSVVLNEVLVMCVQICQNSWNCKLSICAFHCTDNTIYIANCSSK